MSTNPLFRQYNKNEYSKRIENEYPRHSFLHITSVLAVAIRLNDSQRKTNPIPHGFCMAGELSRCV